MIVLIVPPTTPVSSNIKFLALSRQTLLTRSFDAAESDYAICKASTPFVFAHCCHPKFEAGQKPTCSSSLKDPTD